MQRCCRGSDDSETWSLKLTIAKFVLPRLIRYKELASENIIWGCLDGDNAELTQDGILDKMINAVVIDR